jgi:hypothetical protein
MVVDLAIARAKRAVRSTGSNRNGKKIIAALAAA